MDSDIKMFLIEFWVASLEDMCLKIYVKAAINMKRNTRYFQSDIQCLSKAAAGDVSLLVFVSNTSFLLNDEKTCPHMFNNLLLLGDRYALAAVLDLPWCYPRMDPRRTLFKGQSRGSVHRLDVLLWNTSIKRRILSTLLFVLM